ncbi:hypothetical protein BC830DRAFT_1102393 [Chytriomyces sp. MP71]|nr:hypothetical protein BC830DRAFT_1102393 [Chytriomyces sp. MP71]
MNLILACLSLITFVATQKATLSEAQTQLLDTWTAKVNELPACAQYCLYLFDPMASSDPLRYLSDVCQPSGQQSFQTTFNACVVDPGNGCTAGTRLSQAQALINLTSDTCVRLKGLFSPAQTALSVFDMKPLSVGAVMELGPLPSDDPGLHSTSSSVPVLRTPSTQVSTMMPAGSSTLLATTVTSVTSVANSKPAVNSGARAASIRARLATFFLL